MIQIKDKKEASKLRRELAAELSKAKPNPDEVQRIRSEIYKTGFRCGKAPSHVQKWSKNADCSHDRAGAV